MHSHIMINVDICESFAFVKVAITSVGHEYLLTPLQHLMFVDKAISKKQQQTVEIQIANAKKRTTEGTHKPNWAWKWDRWIQTSLSF